MRSFIGKKFLATWLAAYGSLWLGYAYIDMTLHPTLEIISYIALAFCSIALIPWTMISLTNLIEMGESLLCTSLNERQRSRPQSASRRPATRAPRRPPDAKSDRRSRRETSKKEVRQSSRRNNPEDSQRKTTYVDLGEPDVDLTLYICQSRARAIAQALRAYIIQPHCRTTYIAVSPITHCQNGDVSQHTTKAKNRDNVYYRDMVLALLCSYYAETKLGFIPSTEIKSSLKRAEHLCRKIDIPEDAEMTHEDCYHSLKEAAINYVGSMIGPLRQLAGELPDNPSRGGIKLYEPDLLRIYKTFDEASGDKGLDAA